jgi:sterol desaturase/sphingolipid hydroxylase (fatty acid hydroxylase superfamily)
LPFTDSNYGAVFSNLDRALGTFMKLDAKDITYGIDRRYPNEKDEDFMRLIKHPWMKNV